ncbi:MAG: HEAT repeat domain-containing protein [bacterium]
MKWLFGRRNPEAKLLGLLALWHIFETVDLNRPELADKLQDLAQRLEQEFEESKAIITHRAEAGSAADVQFVIDILCRLPAPPAEISPLPNEPDFSWEKAEVGLGPVARVVNGIRIAVQARCASPYEKEILELRRKGGSNAEIKEREDGLRAELFEVDRNFRQYLKSLLHLYELYHHCLEVLARMKSPEGEENLIERLCADQPQERLFALRALALRNWQPKTGARALNFYLAQVKLSDTDAERKKAERELEKLIRSTNQTSEIREVIEPRLAEEGLTQLQVKALERLAEIDPKVALVRFTELFAGGEEPVELKVAAIRSTREKLLPVEPETAVGLLVRALDDLEMEVRVDAAHSLTRLPESTPEPVRNSALERLLFALRDGDLEVRAAAARAINPKAYHGAGEKLAQMLLAETNPNAREFAARSLGTNFSSSSAITAALIKALVDEDAAVRKAAAEALIAQGAVPQDPQTRLQFFCAKQDWGALVAAGLAAVECLIPRLRDLRSEIRLEAVRALGRIRARAAVKEICIALSDSSQEVRKAAARALAEIGDPAAVQALKTAISREGFKEVRMEMERAVVRLT